MLDLCERVRELGGSALLTDGDGTRPFVAPYIFTCEDSGIVISDGEWNCIAFTKHNVLSVRPISNDYNVLTLGIVTCCEVYPRLEEEDSERSLVNLSLTLPPRKPDPIDDEEDGEVYDNRHDHHECSCGYEHDHDEPLRSDDQSYFTYDIGLNRLFTGMYDLTGLGLFCDSAVAVLDATSDEDEAMILLSINSRVQDPSAHCFTVAKLAFDGGLTLIAEDDDGEELRLRLTEDKVADVKRIAYVNNSFYCAQIDLEPMPGENRSNYLQVAVFL